MELQKTLQKTANQGCSEVRAWFGGSMPGNSMPGNAGVQFDIMMDDVKMHGMSKGGWYKGYAWKMLRQSNGCWKVFVGVPDAWGAGPSYENFPGSEIRCVSFDRGGVDDYTTDKKPGTKAVYKRYEYVHARMHEMIDGFDEYAEFGEGDGFGEEAPVCLASVPVPGSVFTVRERVLGAAAAAAVVVTALAGVTAWYRARK
jgi:hypothetical protein